jgi:hypothetical protein
MTPQARTALGAVGLVVTMGSLSFAAVPSTTGSAA